MTGHNSDIIPGQPTHSPGLLSFWWACVQVEAELGGYTIKPDDVILHFSGAGATAIVTAADLNAACSIINAHLNSPPLADRGRESLNPSASPTSTESESNHGL
jgi:hypothetical protein